MGNKPGSRRKQLEPDDTGGKTSKKTNGDVDSGNTGSMKRSKSTTSGKATTTSPGREKKMISCPDLTSGAVPYRDNGSKHGDGVDHPALGAPSDRPKQMEIKIYRSYTNVAEASKRPEPRPDIRVYRRNTSGRRGGETPDRSQTLPRGFGRQRAGTATDNTSASLGAASSGTTGDVATLPRAPPTQRLSSVELKRQSAPGLYALGLGEPRACRRSNSTTSMASIGYKVARDDLPDTAAIKRRLAQFETLFTRCLVKLYSGLPESDQLSSLSIAVRPDRANQHVSLSQYLTSADIPIDLLNAENAHDAENDSYPGPGFLLTIQPALFSGLMKVRHDHPGDRRAAVSVATELLTCLAAESAAELGRIFEYQISLLLDGLSIELLASQAAHCVIDYLKRSGRHLDRNMIVLGAVRGQHVISSEISPKLSVIVGQRELKWEIHEILKKPGLRRELFLFDGNIEVNDDQPPWTFRTSYNHDPMLYGYRGLIVEWDYGGVTIVPDGANTSTTTSAIYRLNGEDEASFTEEMDSRPDDFHRTYCPYRRLVGSGVMQQFAAATQRSNDGSSVVTRATSTLAEYVRRIQGEQYARDQIQPICRPISTLADRLTYDAGSRRHRYSNDNVFTTPDRAEKIPAHEASPVQRPLVVCVANQSTAEVDDERHPVVVVVSPTSPSVKAGDEANTVVDVKSSGTLAMSEQRRSATTSDDDSDEFVDLSETTEYNSPQNVAQHPVDSRHQSADVIETRVTSRDGSTSPKENGHLPNHAVDEDDLETVGITRHTTSTHSTEFVNGWPSNEADLNGMLHHDGEVVMTARNYVIQENTRKTIRSDI